MNDARWEKVKGQVARFWSAMDVEPGSARFRYPLTFSKLKRAVERKLRISVVEVEQLTSKTVEGFLTQNDLWNPNFVKSDESDSPLAGALFAIGDTAIVFVPTEEPPTRRLFSLAHELGHFFVQVYLPYLDSGQKTSYALFNRDAVGVVSRTPEGNLSQRSFIEFTANQFAAELLMPRDVTLTIARRLKGKRKRAVQENTLIEKIVRQFGVSRIAAEYRIRDLAIPVR